MRPTLTPRQIERLIGVLELLSSDFAGERDAAALAATRMVREHGLRWTDVIRPQHAAPHQHAAPEDWRATCAWCAGHRERLNRWERTFVEELPGFRRLSAKQRSTLHTIADRLFRWDGR